MTSTAAAILFKVKMIQSSKGLSSKGTRAYCEQKEAEALMELKRTRRELDPLSECECKEN